MHSTLAISLIALSTVSALPGHPHGRFHNHRYYGPPQESATGYSSSVTNEASSSQLSAPVYASSTPNEGYSSQLPPGSGYTTSSVWPTGTSISASSPATGSAYPTASGGTYPYPNTTSGTNGSSISPDVVRGVNIGAWLVLEAWMTPELFDGVDATDQYTFDALPDAASRLEQHWSTYFTEADVQKIASWGINALRIPIGFWAYDNGDTPYQKGADAYLEKALGWARNAGLSVLIDLHGAPGSQNGFDNSGRSGAVEWQTGDNLDRTISVLETITKKYGCMSYADVVNGIELVNEPISWGANDFSVTQEWTKKAYAMVRAAATNPDLQIVMHDSFATPFPWTDLAAEINGNATIDTAPFAMDTHLYQNQVEEDSELTQDEHIEKACNWTQTNLLARSSNLPVYVGEFSAQTNICANPDGSTTAGSECSVDSCQCSASTDVSEWDTPLIDATRRFLEAELDAFEEATRGWYIWSYKGPGVWGMDNAIKYGVLGPKVMDRKFAGQCGFA